MIFLHAIFLVLAIFRTSTSQGPLYPSRHSIIDWRQCRLTAKCGCNFHGSLKYENSIPALPPTAQDSEEGKCNIGMHVRYFNYETALLQMQIIGEDIAPNSKLIFHHGTQLSVGCIFGSKVELHLTAEDQDFKDQIKISLYEDLSQYKSKNLHCAIKIGRADKLVEGLSNIAPFIEMRLTNGGTETNYGNDENWARMTAVHPLCNPYSFEEKYSSLKYHVLPVRNRHMDVINCDSENYEKKSSEKYTSSYTFRYQTSNGDYHDAKELKCYENPTNSAEHYYTIIKEDTDLNAGPPERLNSSEKYQFFCGAEFNERCEDPNDCAKGSDGCPVYEEGKKGIAATLKCTDKKWIIDGDYRILSEEPECKRDDITSSNKASFFFKYPGTNRPKKNVRCFTDYNCTKESKLHLPLCNEGDTECGRAIDNGAVLKCEDKNKELIIYSSAERDVNYTMSGYTCEPKTGLYFNGTTTIPASSRVKCIGETKTFVTTKEAKLSEGQIVTYIGIAFVGTAVLLIGIFVIAHFCNKRAKKVRKREKKYWMNLKSEQRINRCKVDFDKILHSTVDTSEQLIAGFNILETMLETETEEAECWDEVCKYLYRFRGAIVRIDNGIWHMFSRYLYLQSKKIIDKHTWLAPEPITKRNRKGLMRAAAVRLLAFAMNDPHNPETEELIAAGYSKLRFKAASQYPHCGLVWSLIMHTRAINREEQADKKLRVLDNKKFLYTLMDVAGGSQITLSKEDVIPLYGTLEEQAAFALGASPSLNFHASDDGGKKVLKTLNNSNDAAVPKSFFKGINALLWRLTSQAIVDSFAFRKEEGVVDADKLILREVRKIAPVAVWNQLAREAITMLTYCGYPLDAKRLPTLFELEGYDEELNQERLEQQEFLNAVEKETENLRAWFAKRTDKEELKKKPVYVANAKFKLDNASEGAATPVEAGAPPGAPGAATESVGPSKTDTNTKSNQASGSSGESGGKTPATPSEPTDPAAGGAAAAAAAANPKPAEPAAPAAPPASAYKNFVLECKQKVE